MTVCLCFDTMAIDETLQYSPQMDLVEGFVDFGGGHRTNAIASHALVFMLRVATKNFKQIIGFFLYGSSISWVTLQSLINNALRYYNEAGLKVIAIVCN